MSRSAVAAEAVAARRSRERRVLRALGLPLLAVVVVPSALAHPDAPASAAIAVVAASFAVLMRWRLPALAPLAPLALMAAAGVVLIAEQPSGTGELTLSLVAWIAATRLPTRLGVGLVAVAGVAASAALALDTAHPAESVVTDGLLVALLFVMARLFRRAQDDRERAELAAAELADARERELRSAAVAERARIARELHDVLAHSLSGLSLHLEGARLLAEREQASPQLREALARARRLAADGVEEARRAVRALQGERMPGVEDLPALAEGCGLRVDLRVQGARPLAPEAGLALYRAAQEALTNAARHSGADRATLEVVFDADRVRLVVTDNGAGRPPVAPVPGTGYGLSAMRERAALLGGRVRSGPTGEGYRVELELPA